MKARLLENTAWGPAGTVVNRSDSAFVEWCKHNAVLVQVINPKPKVKPEPKTNPESYKMDYKKDEGVKKDA